MHLVNGCLFQSPYDITRAREGAEWVSGHIFCLSQDSKHRWNKVGSEACGGLFILGIQSTRSQTQSKQKALGETEAQRGAEACLRSHSQLEAQLGVEQRGEAGLFV